MMAIFEHAGRVFKVANELRMSDGERLEELRRLLELALMHLEIGRASDAITVLQIAQRLSKSRREQYEADDQPTCEAG